MAHKRKQPSHFVQVARIRIETAIFGIDADDGDDADAEREAIETANSIADVDWVMQPFDHASYQPHVQSIISQEEIEEVAEIGSTKSAETLVDASEDIHYLLLQADCASGEGHVVLQPRLVVDEPNLLTSDLCREWVASLQGLGLTHMSERLDDLASGAQPHNHPIRSCSAQNVQRSRRFDVAGWASVRKHDWAFRCSPDSFRIGHAPTSAKVGQVLPL